LGTQDDRKSTSRLWMNRLEFSKVIGKGGQTISNIRTTCGAQVKGTDIDAENRLVVVTGTLRQVLEAFEMITDLMHAAYCQTVPSEHFSVQMLLEHSKVSSVFTPIVLHEKKSLINAMEQLILIPLGWPCGGPKGCHDSKSQGQERCNANSHAERSQGINAHGRPLRHLPSSPLLLPLDLSL
jgi:predicted RNA-binding protein YlqC (UPF0109 family)